MGVSDSQTQWPFFIGIMTMNHQILQSNILLPIGSMYGIYANSVDILMVNVTIYIAYMDPMGSGKHTTYDHTIYTIRKEIMAKPPGK